MPPMFYDLELEPWMSAEQPVSSNSRAFQQESGPSAQRLVYPETGVDRRRGHASNRVQGDANRLQPSKRKQVNGGSSPPEQSTAKKQKNLTETDLAIIKLAAGILEVPVTSLLATRTETAEHSESSSTTYDSLEAPSTGPEQADGYDLTAEPTRHPHRYQQPAPTSAPAFQPVGGFHGNTTAGYPEPPTFRDELNINSKNHLEWWGLNPGLVFNDFDASTSGGQQAGGPVRQEPSSHVDNDNWGHGDFGDTVFTSVPVTSNQPAWTSTPHGLSHGYHEPAPPHRMQNQPSQNLVYFGPVPPPHGRQAFGSSSYGGRSRQDPRAANVGSAITELDGDGNPLGTTFGNQEIPQPNQDQGNAQNYVAKRPRPSRRINNAGDVRKPGRRGPLTDEQRRETCLTRQKGACIRCQRQAIKCKRDPSHPDGPCIPCRDVYGVAMINLPCLRYKVHDAQLVDKDVHPKFIWSRRWKSMKVVEIEEWRTPEIKTITLTQDVEGLTYDLQVREFIPVEGDSLFRAWRTNGEEKMHAVTNYAIAYMAQTGLEFAAFAEKSIGKFIKFYIDKNDKLMWNTYCMAYKYSIDVERKEERDLLRNALKLWVGSRMESRRERICSTEVLGMQPQNWDVEADNYQAYLIPPVLQAQIELLTTAHVLLPMRREVLKGLQKLMKANLSRSWFSIYLCMFLLMHSCALLTKAESVRARREPWGSSLPQPRYYNPRLVEELHMGANILLGHFHYCNKGSYPFHMDWKGANNSNTAFAELATEQISYMQVATDEVRRRANRFQTVKEQKMFEDEYYFLSQLYDKDWKPTHTI